MNPYIFDKPVSQTEMFVGRAELIAEFLTNSSRHSVRSYSLIGGRRLGKTSLLRELERKLKENLARDGQSIVLPVYLDMNYEIIETREQFFTRIIERMFEVAQVAFESAALELNIEELNKIQHSSNMKLTILDSFVKTIQNLNRYLFGRNKGLRIQVLIDESERISVQQWAPEVFSNLNSILTNSPLRELISIIMAGSSDFYSKVREPGSPLQMILQQRFLTSLSDTEARFLINAPMNKAPTEDIITEIILQTGRHPFLIQYIMYYIYDLSIEEVTVDKVRQVAAKLPEEMPWVYKNWYSHLGIEAQKLYFLLTQESTWLKRSILLSRANKIGVRSDEYKSATEALSYHACIETDSSLGYKVNGEMFRNWFGSIYTEKALDIPFQNTTNTDWNFGSYQEFELNVTAAGHISARSPQGEEDNYLKLDLNTVQAVLNSIEKGQVNEQILKNLGNDLYNQLFKDNINTLFHKAITFAESHGTGTRIRLVFDDPQLSAIPWEFLYDTNSDIFIGNNPRTTLSRYIKLGKAVISPLFVKPPTRILVVISAPKDLPELDVDAETLIINSALERHLNQNKVEIDVISDATVRNIKQKLREKAYNIFHFVGHGNFVDSTGVIALIDANSNALYINDENFSNFFLENPKVSLCILNTCKGAVQGTSQSFVGLAPKLVRRGLPAVIAMQFDILDSTAKIFTDELYRTLALGWPIDAAVQAARNSISIEIGLDKPDFATPVLFMRGTGFSTFAER